MSNNILVAGASGQIGSHIVELLQAAGADFTAGLHNPGALSGINSVVFDFDNHASMVTAMHNTDTLFLVAPLTPQMRQWSQNAVQAAREAGVRHIVRSSGAGADARSPFAIARIQGEIDQLIIDSGLACTFVRPTTFMQNFLTFHLQGIREQGSIYQPQGDGKTGYIHVRDIAAVAVEILLNPKDHEGKAYDLTGAEALSNAEVAAILSECTGRTIQYVDVPEEAAEQSMQASGLPPVIIEQLMSLHKLTKMGYAASLTPTVKAISGQDPISFREFAAANAEIWH